LDVHGSYWLVSKFGFNLLKGLITYSYRGYNPVTKYHGHPDTPLKFNSSPVEKWWLQDDPFLVGGFNPFEKY